MKWVEIFRYELEYRLRAPSTWVYAVLLFGFAVANGVDVLAVGAVNANAPLQLAKDAVFTGLLGLVVTAALFGEAALRDVDAGMEPLLLTLPLRTVEYVGGRFLAALATNALLLLAVPLGYALPTLIGYPDPALFGPFRAAAVLEPWLILLLPNLALSGAILFTVAVFSRRLVPVYITGFGFFMVSLLLAELRVADPTGIGWLEEMKVAWPATEQNSRLISSSSEVWWNRLCWLAVTGAILALLLRRFRFAYPDSCGTSALPACFRRLFRPKKSGGRASAQVPSSTPRSLDTVPLRAARVATSFGARTALRQTLAIARNSFVETVANRWFFGFLLACAAWAASLVEKTTERSFDMLTWPATMLVTALLSTDLLAGIFVLVGFYAGELVWKDRDVGAADIVDAAPVAESSAVLGRLLALIAIGTMFLAASMAGGILGQLGHDYYNVEPGLYLRVLGLNLADVALIAVLVLTTHVVVNHKYLGMGAMLVALVIPFTGPLLRHYLLVYGGDAGWTYSDINGFGPFLKPFMWFKLYSGGWALALVIVACLLWVRGRETGKRRWVGQARARFVGRVRGAAGVALALILLIGGFIFYNTNVLNTYGAPDETQVWRAEYEKRFGRFEKVAQPAIESARLRVEIYPEEQAVDLSGSFRLVNRSEAPIDSIHVFSQPRLLTRSISFDREATAVVTDSEVGHRIYALTLPLAPGDALQLSFELEFRQRGFPNSGFQMAVAENGTYFGRGWLPFVGYQPERQLSDFEVEGEGDVQVETTIGTAGDQTAITSGVLRREWQEGGRRYFHYGTESPQPFAVPVFSGRYATRVERWHDASAVRGREVTLTICHHPGHARNVDAMLRNLKAALAHLTTEWGPYDASDLRVVEVPRYHREIRAHPNLIALSEGRFLVRMKEGQIDPFWFGTDQELGRHWWGRRVTGAPDERGGGDIPQNRSQTPAP